MIACISKSLQANLITENAAIVAKVTQEVNSRYAQYQRQHQEFVGHLNGQITQIEQQLTQIMAAPPPQQQPPPPPTQGKANW